MDQSILVRHPDGRIRPAVPGYALHAIAAELGPEGAWAQIDEMLNSDVFWSYGTLDGRIFFALGDPGQKLPAVFRKAKRGVCVDADTLAPCRYYPHRLCHCEGRGFCLEVA